MEPNQYATELVAQDPDGNTVRIANWTMRVRTRAKFAVNTSDTGCGEAQLNLTRAAVENIVDRAPFQDQASTVIVPALVGSSSACDLSSMFINYRVDRDGEPDVRFTLKVTDRRNDGAASSLGEDAFVNADTGKLLLKLDNLGKFNVTLQAEQSGSDPIDLLSWIMHVRVGPNNSTCGSNGVPNPADAELDNYTCVCTNDFTGPICDEAPVASAVSGGDDDNSSVAIGASLGSVVLVMAIALAAFRVQLYRIKHRPQDMNGMQDEVLDGIGIRLPKDIADHEFGVTLTFRDETIQRLPRGAVWSSFKGS